MIIRIIIFIILLLASSARETNIQYQATPAANSFPVVATSTIPKFSTSTIKQLPPQRTSTTSIKDLVIAAFPHTPMMWEVARCESRYRQFKDGDVLRGEVNPHDIGIFQINESYHGDEARSLGYNIDTTAGNIAFAKVLYDRQGLNPWYESRSCWEN